MVVSDALPVGILASWPPYERNEWNCKRASIVLYYARLFFWGKKQYIESKNKTPLLMGSSAFAFFSRVNLEEVALLSADDA